MNQPPPAVTQDNKPLEQLEANRGHDEEVRRCNPVRVVAQEGRPTLARSSGTLDHVLGDCRLGDLDAELEQLAMDTRAPTSSWRGSSPDQLADLRGNRGAANSGT